LAYRNASGAWSVTLTGGLTPNNITLQTCESIDCLTAPFANTSEFSPLSQLNPFKGYLPFVKK
jgi:hypothetical protein